MCVVSSALVLLFAGGSFAQVPRGFARPAGGRDAQPNANEPPAGAVNANLGMAGLHKLAQDPSSMAEMMELLKDPQALAEAKAMMEDPAFQREMEKVAGPLKKALKDVGGMAPGQANVRAALIARPRAHTHAHARLRRSLTPIPSPTPPRAPPPSTGAAWHGRPLTRDAGAQHARGSNACDAGSQHNGRGQEDDG
jgi:hypothetical protein